jgi:hypothetical protein
MSVQTQNIGSRYIRSRPFGPRRPEVRIYCMASSLGPVVYTEPCLIHYHNVILIFLLPGLSEAYS